jgi:RNA polymerase sigma factor (sigma-70 family)
MRDIPDGELLAQYTRTESEEAFAELVRRHIALVYSVALRHTDDPQHAQEITQAAFIILARKAASLGRRTVLSGWLYHTARLTAANFRRAEFRRVRREQEAFMQSTLEETPPDTVWRELAPLLDEAMARLGTTDRDAVVLRYFENKSLREVGAALGVEERAAQKRVSRALEKLRRFFTKRGVVSTTAIIGGAMAAHSVQAAPAAVATAATVVAIAKGASASASTLALIEGALKIMAWTKAKTAAVATAAVIVAAGTTAVAIKTIHAARAAAYPDIQGAWEGVVVIGGPGVAKGETTRTRVVLKLSKTNGGYSATGDALEMGRRNVPLTVAYDYPSLRLEVNPRTTYDGTVNADATEISFGPGNDPVVLKRTTTPPQVPERLTESDFAARSNSGLQGFWKGAIGTGPDALPLNWKIAGRPDGTFRAELDNPMQGANGQPVSVVYNPPEVKLILKTGSAMFQGKLNGAKTEMTGSWIQAGQSTPSVFKRADYQAEHAQDADKDYSFTSETDLQGHWKGTWILPFGKVKVKMRFALDIAKLPDGSYSAALANLDQFGNDAPIPASVFRYSPPNLRMEWKWARGAFEGKLENGKIIGTWLQGGGGFPLVFERSR